MYDTVYLHVSRKKVVRMTHPPNGRPPAVREGEYAIRINIQVPDAAFKRFIPEANLFVPEKGLIPPTPTVTVVTPPE